MRTLIVALLLAIFASSASAGSVQITVTAGGGLSYTLTSTIPDANLNQLVAFSRSTYGQVVVTPAVVDANGNTTPAVMRNMTAGEAVAAWWMGILRQTGVNLSNIARESAARTARDAIAPVAFGDQ